MAFVIENNEKSVATVKMIIPADEFERGMRTAYQKNKNRFNVPGFRLGKAPRNLIEARYGKDIFYQDALDAVFADVYNKNMEESGLDVISQPRLMSVDKIDENGAELTLELSLMPVFELGDYKNIPIGSLEYEPTQEDIDAEIDKNLKSNARQLVLESELAEEGDTMAFDFEGFLDGEAFEGGQAENFSLVLGSGNFIPGFEEKLIGHSAGEEFDIEVVFPEDYGSEMLAGKPAIFKIKVNDIKRTELPELDDDFAIDIGYESIEDMKANFASSIRETKESSILAEANNYLMGYLIKNTPIDLPPKFVSEQAVYVRDDYEYRLRQSGYEPQQFYQYMMETSENIDETYFMQMWLAQAAEQIKADLIMQELIKEFLVEATEDEIEAEMNALAEQQSITLDEFKEDTYYDSYRARVINELQAKKVYENLVKESDTENPRVPLVDLVDNDADQEGVLTGIQDDEETSAEGALDGQEVFEQESEADESLEGELSVASENDGEDQQES
ncbi:MAG: trigger factor [Eubacteriaceae bacterium]|jgi:trigger factor|nr:trigger factor [Eubacteriaceae bacterium]